MQKCLERSYSMSGSSAFMRAWYSAGV
ncbi:hypothetical protein Ctob_008665 [Chrysochromulina tobinii]|uniref:Uncharacterized protein n=1 Tax=Chrysochromulina tobinii TaxID=1460289 RepID=A0A0M0JFD8_9EUKA|nr:hypothetical protein Ctob_008665 [Chrysochromulina tobinii]|eukprot:KOO25160.1 hypothetical protein Ctob_008665 [Chrysochromulina sp. CCMP291]